jgi:hypothetical protein
MLLLRISLFFELFIDVIIIDYSPLIFSLSADTPLSPAYAAISFHTAISQIRLPDIAIMPRHYYAAIAFAMPPPPFRHAIISPPPLFSPPFSIIFI